MKEHVLAQDDLGKTLELGCGTGTYSRLLMRASKELVATDLSDEMIAATKERVAGAGNVRIEKADCLALSYPDAEFDTVFAANLLHVIPEPERALKEVRRVLKKHGKLVILSFTFESMTFFNKIVMIYRYLSAFGKPSPDAYALTVKEARRMLQNSGFSVKEASIIGNRSKAIFVEAGAV
jgi:ubiquinone/menaquinone biosynthesis C-methylase UbiE